MTKYRAFLIHLSASVIVLSLVISVMLLIWSPAPYFDLNGGWTILKIVFGVDVVLGPLFTLIVFKPNKPSLKFDLSVIVAIQLSALIYGSTVIYQNRPAFIVFAVDRFTIVRASDIAFNQLPTELTPRPLIAKPRLVWAEIAFGDLMLDIIMGKQPDIEFHADRYRSYPPPIEKLTARSIDIDQLTAHDNNARQRVTAFLARHDLKTDAAFFFPLRGKYGDQVFVLNRNTAQPIGAIAISPWASDYPTK